MKKLFASIIILFSVLSCWACTSAIISGEFTANGRPLLWKHRDTSEEHNRVARIPATKNGFEYVALYNSSDKNNREAWIGYNEHGFAIMNTASYNLKDDKVSSKNMDKEGFLMSRALATCSTVDDFESFLKDQPKPLGVEANFGVIDAQGDGAYFETNNYTYKKYDLKNAPNGVLVRTNYSHSGREDEGYGYIREMTAETLINQQIKNKDITPSTFTEYISRSFYHSLIGSDAATSGATWVVDQDFIPRRSSTASVVIEGVAKGESPLLTTMWTSIGYPPCAEVMPVWLGADGIPSSLLANPKTGRSPQCDVVLKRKYDVFSIKRGSGKSYLNIKKLYNEEGTGYCQVLHPKNMESYKKGYEQLEQRRKK